MVFLVVIVAVLSVACCVLVMQQVRIRKELRRMAQFLEYRNQEDNARLTASVRSRGFLELDRAINRQLDELQAERIALLAHERDFRMGLTGLSHDIRTPLAGAQGYAKLLSDEEDPQERRRYQANITRRLSDLQQMLDQLFTYAQVSDIDYRLELEQIDLTAALGEALASFYPQFQEKEWTPEVSLADWAVPVEANAEALSRMFRNLTANSLKHGAAAPSIRQTGTTVVFENRVFDPDALELDRLFDRFYTAGAGSSGGNTKGSGLGLAIVDQLSHAMRARAVASLEGNLLRITLSFE